MDDSKLQKAETIKFILLGEDWVGKTSLRQRYINKTFASPNSTIGLDYVTNFLKIKDKDIKLIILDTAGQERFRSITKSYIKHSKIALIVYDITRKRTFEELNYWINAVKEVNKDKEIIIGIAANKSDLYYKQEISTEEGKKFADDNNCLFFETSAKGNVNVDDAFLKLVEKYVFLEEEKELEEDKLFKNFDQ